MMIGKGMRLETKAKPGQMIEEALRLADAGHGVQAQSREFGGWHGWRRRSRAWKRSPARVMRKSPPARDQSLATTRIDRPQARLRLAQGPGRQRPAIPEAAPVEHGNLHVARKAVVLQTVVAENHVAVRMRGQQRPAGGDAIPADKDRAAGAAADQQRFVANQFGGAIGRRLRPRHRHRRRSRG